MKFVAFQKQGTQTIDSRYVFTVINLFSIHNFDVNKDNWFAFDHKLAEYMSQFSHIFPITGEKDSVSSSESFKLYGETKTTFWEYKHVYFDVKSKKLFTYEQTFEFHENMLKLYEWYLKKQSN